MDGVHQGRGQERRDKGSGPAHFARLRADVRGHPTGPPTGNLGKEYPNGEIHALRILTCPSTDGGQLPVRDAHIALVVKAVHQSQDHCLRSWPKGPAVRADRAQRRQVLGSRPRCALEAADRQEVDLVHDRQAVRID